jgi:hypothetical protein
MTYNTVSKQVDTFWIEDSAWKQMEGILCTVDDDGVTSIRSTIESSTDIEVLGEDINKLALSFVTPLGTKNDSKLRVEASFALGG